MICILQMTSPCLNPQSHKHRPSWPKHQKQQLILALSSVHQRQSMWLWTATHSQPFKSMEIQSTMDVRHRYLEFQNRIWNKSTEKGCKNNCLVSLLGSWIQLCIEFTTSPMQQKLTLFNTYLCHYTTFWLLIMGDLPWFGKQNQRLWRSHAPKDTPFKRQSAIVLNTTVYFITNSLPLINSWS